MSERGHIIRSQVVEFTFADEGSFLRRQDEMSDLYKSRILPAMERAFDKFVPEGVTLRLDKIELDLGAFTPEEIEKEIGNVVQTTLEQYLSTLQLKVETGTLSSGEEPPQELNSEARDLEIVLHYLQHGMIPWWARVGNDKPVVLLYSFLQEPGHRFFDVVVPLLREFNVRKRLSSLLSREQFSLLVQAVADESGRMLNDFILFFNSFIGASGMITSSDEKWLRQLALMGVADSRELKNKLEELPVVLIEKMAGISAESSPGEFNRLLRDILTFAEGSRGPGANAFIEQLQAAFARMYPGKTVDPEQRSPGKKIIEEEESPSGKKKKAGPQEDEKPVKYQTSPVENQELPAAKENKQKALHDKKLKGKQVEPPSESPVSEKPGEMESSLQEEVKQQNQVQPPEEDKETYSESAPELTLEEKFRLFQKQWEEEGHRQVSKGPAWKTEADAVFVQNAGLVILWPFLKYLFEGQGWVVENKFKNEECRSRAVVLLNYLATGEVNTAGEEELIFEKIMCGLAPDEVVEADVVLTEEEMKEGDLLLDTVLERWEVLRRTSPQGLRNTFLRREGKLSAEGSNLRVVVARETLDILMDRLPWGVGIIRLPWREGLIFVDW